MIVVKTGDLETTINDINDVFQIENMFDVITDVDEVKEYVEMWSDMFGTDKDERSGLVNLRSPLIVFTPSNLVIEELQKRFTLIVLEPGEQIYDNLISGGILPTDEEFITDYALRHFKPSDGCKQAILSMFQVLGYIDNNKFATNKLLITLEDVGSDEARKYAQTLLYIRDTNDVDIKDSTQYEVSLLEILKLVDIHIHSAVYGIEMFEN